MDSHESIVICIIIVITLLWYGTQNKPSYNRVPKKIWTYWREEPNGLVYPSKKELECVESWKKWNPEYEIITLTKKTFPGYVIIPNEIREHPIFIEHDRINTDFIHLVRLWTLAEHGGVWLDSTVMLTRPLDEWMFPRYAEFSGIYKEGIETYFMAVNRKSAFLREWVNSFSKLATATAAATANANAIHLSFKEVFYKFPAHLFVFNK